MQEFNFLKQQFLSLQIPINEHYLNRYIKFILALPELKRKDGYCESHHILPESLFPQYAKKRVAPWNQKKINTRAHYLCHWMLWKGLVGNISMSRAFWGMSNQMKEGRTYKVNSRIYSKLRMEFSKISRDFHLREDVNANKVKLYKEWRARPEVMEMYSNMMSGENNPAKRPEVREKISLGNKKWSADHHDELVARGKMAYANNPDLAKTVSDRQTKYYADNPGVKKDKSDKMKAWAANLDNQEKRAISNGKMTKTSWGKNSIVWSNADHYYRMWLTIGMPKPDRFLNALNGEERKRSFDHIILRFIGGWVPDVCPLWLEWKSENFINGAP